MAWPESKQPIVTNKGIEQKALRHREVSCHDNILSNPIYAPIKTYDDWKDVPKNLMTKSALGKKGLKPKNLNTIIAKFHDSYYGSTYDLFSVDDAIPKRKVNKIAPKALPLTIKNIGLALYTINKAAKRRRDAAERSYQINNHSMSRMQKDEKEKLYNLKNKVMKRTIVDGIAKFEGIHQQTRNEVKIIYNDYDYEEKYIKKITYLACYSIDNYRFHEITNKPKDNINEIKELGNWVSEAVPQGDLKIKDAIATLEKYLKEGI